MDLFYFICYPLVFQLAFWWLPMQPFIIRRMRNISKLTQAPDGIAVIFVFLFYRPVYGFMPDQAQPRLLSTTMYLWLIPLTASKELSILLLKLLE